MIATENLNGVSGVYCAIHRDSLKCYVGSSKDVGARKRQHVESARNGRLGNFHRAIREFGENAFDFELIERCEQKELKKREDFWIMFYEAASLKGFNTLPYSSAFERGKASQVTKDRISASKTGKVSLRLIEHLKKLNASKIGVKRPIEVVQKVSLKLKGRKNTPEQMARQLAATSGNKPSAAMLEAARIANTGKPRSEAVKAKIKAGLKRIWSQRDESRKREIMSHAWVAKHGKVFV